MAEGRVYSAEFTMTKDSYLKMNRDLRGQRMRRASLVLLSVMILAGSGLVYKDIPVAGWFLVTGGLCMPALMQISWRNSVRRQYDSAKMAHDLTSTYTFFPDHLEVTSPSSDLTVRYDDLYQIVETRDMFYLALEENHSMPVPKTSRELSGFLHSLGKQPEHKALLRPMYLLFYIASFTLSGLLLIFAFKPEGDWVRNWVIDLLFLTLILFQLLAVLCGISWNLYSISKVATNGKRILLRVVSVLFCAALVVAILAGMVVIAFGMQTTHKNTNETYTGISRPFLDKATYTLLAGDGPFYLRYLRPMSGEEDTDPDVSEEEWLKSHTPDTASEESSTDTADESASFEEDIDDNASAELDSVHERMDEELKKQEEGYQKIYDTYFAAAGDSFSEMYDAKGNSYYILKEDDTSIRFLKYDRDSKNGACGLYVLYQADKSSDGSWSAADASILNTYAYAYETGNTAESGKKDWADAGSEEYQALTGEP